MKISKNNLLFLKMYFYFLSFYLLSLKLELSSKNSMNTNFNKKILLQNKLHFKFLIAYIAFIYLISLYISFLYF